MTDLFNEIDLNFIFGNIYDGFCSKIILFSLSISFSFSLLFSCSHFNKEFLEVIDIILFEYILIEFIFSEFVFNSFIDEKLFLFSSMFSG